MRVTGNIIRKSGELDGQAAEANAFFKELDCFGRRVALISKGNGGNVASSFCSDGGQEDMEMIDGVKAEVVEAEEHRNGFEVDDLRCCKEIAYRLGKRIAATETSSIPTA